MDSGDKGERKGRGDVNVAADYDDDDEMRCFCCLFVVVVVVVVLFVVFTIYYCILHTTLYCYYTTTLLFYFLVFNCSRASSACIPVTTHAKRNGTLVILGHHF